MKLAVALILMAFSSFLPVEAQACRFSPYDLNRDGRVDMLDLALMCAHYNQHTPRRCDLNGDGIIDIYDVVTWISHSGYRG